MPKPINHTEIINLNDTMMDVALKMSEGNPGAVTVVIQLLSSKHDPDSWCGGFGNLMSLDTHGIYGSNIWVLYKDVCAQNILNVVTVLRAIQLGFYTEKDLWRCIDTSTPLDVQELYGLVKRELPMFNT
jgi:hypothetical protein